MAAKCFFGNEQPLRILTVTYALVNPKTKMIYLTKLQRRQNIEKLLTMTTIAISWKKPTIALSIIFRLIRKMLERRIKN